MTSGLGGVHDVYNLVPRSVPVLYLDPTRRGGEQMSNMIRRLWADDSGQDIAEYAVMLAVILVLVVGTVRLIGSNANNAFSSVASSLQ